MYATTDNSLSLGIGAGVPRGFLVWIDVMLDNEQKIVHRTQEGSHTPSNHADRYVWRETIWQYDERE